MRRAEATSYAPPWTHGGYAGRGVSAARRRRAKGLVVQVRDAVIVEALRSPIGRRNGSLKDVHPVDLSGEVLKGLIGKAGIDPGIVDDVIWGCVGQVGEQAFNIARWCWLSAGFPEDVPATSVDRQCGSAQQAIHFAAQGVMSGQYDVVVAGGVESMTRVPMGSSMNQGPGMPFGKNVMARYPGLVPQGLSAEMIAEKWKITREDVDTFSLESHRRAIAATDGGHFKREIVPIEVPTEDGGKRLFDTDECFRRETSAEKLAGLKPAFKEGGVVTAGNSSQISDGAAAVIIMSEEKAKQLKLTPRARLHAFALAAVDPVIMLSGPIPATQKILAKSGLTMNDIDVTEINEAFASVVLAWAKELKPDMAKVNPNGGAVALGHPLGSTGARLCTTLLHELERTGGRYGLQTLCEGGGTANATIIERLG